MDLIRKDVAIAELEKTEAAMNKEAEIKGMRLARFIINSVPPLSLMRCAECKHWKQAPKTEKGWCDRLDGLLEPTWFCADGERKERE